MSRHDDKVYLGHIHDSIEKIEQYVENDTFEQFQNDDETIDSVARHLEIIGEASNNISDNFCESHPNMDFRPAIDMRNWLAHGYDQVDLEVVWKTIKEDLPILKDQIEALL